MESAGKALRSWFNSDGFVHRDVVVDQIRWERVNDVSKYPDHIKIQLKEMLHRIDAIYKAKIQFKVKSNAYGQIRFAVRDTKPAEGNTELASNPELQSVPTVVFYPNGEDARLSANYIASVPKGGIYRSELSSTSKFMTAYSVIDVQKSSCSDPNRILIEYWDRDKSISMTALFDFAGASEVMYFIDSTVIYITHDAHENDNI